MHSPSPRSVFRRPVLLLCSALLCGCAAVGPQYQAPVPQQLTVPSAWQAALPHAGDTGQLLAWWEQFHDATLNQLLQSAEASNPSLRKAAANIASARANVSTANAAGQPTLTGSAAASRGRTTGTSTTTTTTGALDASWELDLFGSVRRSVESADALVSARRLSWW